MRRSGYPTCVAHGAGRFHESGMSHAIAADESKHTGRHARPFSFGDGRGATRAGRHGGKTLVDSLLFTTNPAFLVLECTPGMRHKNKGQLSRWPAGARFGDTPCKSPVFRLYYQEKAGLPACKSAAAALFFGRPSPVSVSFYRGCRRRCRGWMPRYALPGRAGAADASARFSTRIRVSNSGTCRSVNAAA